MRLVSVILFAASTLAGPAAGEELTVYTSQPRSDAAQTVGGFMRLHPDINVRWIRSGTTVIVDKLSAERANGAPPPDILFIASAITMERLKRDGRLAAYPEAPVTRLPVGAFDPEGYWFGTKIIAMGIGRRADAPAAIDTLADLSNPAIADRVAISTPNYSGSAAYLLATLTQNSAFGWRFYENLADGGASVVRGNGRVLWSLATGRADYGIIADFMALGAGSGIEYAAPKDAAIAIMEPAAIMAGARNERPARLFIDFLLSRSGAELAAAQGYTPVRRDVAAPKGYPPIEGELMTPDFNRAIAEHDASLDRFAELFGEPAPPETVRGD